MFLTGVIVSKFLQLAEFKRCASLAVGPKSGVSRRAVSDDVRNSKSISMSCASDRI